jgi:hypothetical protein
MFDCMGAGVLIAHRGEEPLAVYALCKAYMRLCQCCLPVSRLIAQAMDFSLFKATAVCLLCLNKQVLDAHRSTQKGDGCMDGCTQKKVMDAHRRRMHCV